MGGLDGSDEMLMGVKGEDGLEAMPIGFNKVDGKKR